MRKKRIDIYTVFFATVVAIFSGLFSLVFSSKMNTTTDSVSVVALQPAAVVGQGHYIFESPDKGVGVDKNWYIELNASGPGSWTDKRVGTTLSANITYVDFNFRFGSNSGNHYWYMGNFKGRSSHYSVSGSMNRGDTNYSTTYDKGNDTSQPAHICEMSLGEGEYNFTFHNVLYKNPGNWFNEAWTEEEITIKLIVDRKAPIVVLTGVSNNGVTKGTVKAKGDGKAWNDDAFTLKYSRTNLNQDKPSSATSSYTANSALSAEGHYGITATDKAGNTSSLYSFTIDKTKPENNFGYTTSGGKAYTNNDIVYKPTDNLSLSEVFVKYKDGPWASSQSAADAAGYDVIFNDKQITVPKESGNGEWHFLAKDTADNYSDEYIVVLTYMDTFGNQERICNSYISNYWYNVVLPANIFGDETGIYSAARYDTALSFARQKEWEYRVTPTQNGWRYVSSGNGNLTQEYTDRAELDAVVDKYAKSYIRDRSVAKNGTNNFNKIINDNLQIDNAALVRQQIAKPNFLPDDDLPIYMMRKDFKFVDPKFPSQTYVKMQMVANDLALVTRAEVNLDYDVKVENQVLTTGNNSQGYYLVTEWDNSGNIEEYYVYIDLSAPTLTVDVVYGNNTNEIITFDESKVEELAGTFRYLSLNMQTLVDSMDRFVTMKINGRKLSDAVYIQGDELPILDGVTYYGNYSIELYDRSGNTLNFTVTIAGEAPRMLNSSLNSDTTCRLTLDVPDHNDVITDIKLFYITYEGEYRELTADHKDVPVTVDTLQYTLTTGGKYTLWYQDLFGREAYCTPVFYLKGLPTATLSGVTDGGITNKNVSLKYNEGNSLILYRIENGNKTEVPLDGTIYSQTYDETSHRYTAMLMASEETTAAYEFFLYKSGDKNLFVEYTFSIDCIIAPIYIRDIYDIVVDKNSYTNRPFTIIWNETVTLRYYTSKTPGGEMGAERYTMGTVLSENGTYYFTLKDSVGNQESFTILLDTVVSYEIGGEYVKLNDHEYIAKNDLRFSITEAATVLSFTSIPDVVNGGYITTEGVYSIAITDAYGNSVEITITIDRTAPEIELLGVGDSGATNTNVQVNLYDFANAYLVNIHDQIIARVTNGQVFDIEGSYRIMATDIAGNAAYAVFSINRTIPYESNVVNGAITTNSVTLSFLGEIREQNVFYNNAEKIDAATRYTTAGEYLIEAVDNLGNLMRFGFTILPTRTQVVDLENLDDYAVVSATLNGVAALITVTDGKLYFDTNGKYVIKMENTKENNVFEFNIEIDNVVLYEASFAVGGLTTDNASLTFNETVKQTVTLNGKEIKTAKTYKEPGDYKITATDELGNVTEITFTILPTRTREIHLERLDNYELVLVTFGTKTLDNAKIVDNTLTFKEKGMYAIVLKIKGTGEVFSCGIEVDNTKPTVTIEKDAGSFKTSHASKENLVATLSCNGGEATAYTVGKKISGAGHYTLTITDDLGNTNEYSFDITEPLNWAAYASIGGLGLLGAVALIVVLKAKRRVKTR